MNTNNAPRASDAQTLKLDALDLLKRLNDNARALSRIHERADHMGLNAVRAEGDSELDYLSKLALEANEKEMELMAQESRTRTQHAIDGRSHSGNGPSSFLGRAFNSLAQRLG